MDILRGIRIVEFAHAIAGPYCSKLFADFGAEVIKVEPPTGDPFRSRATGQLREGDDGALFKFLNANKSSVVGTAEEPRVQELIANADVFIDAAGPGVFDHAKLLHAAPSLVVVALSPYGHNGPYRLRPATEFTVQAESGTIALRGRTDQPPLQAGGRAFEWLMGTYAAVAALAAVMRASAGGGGEIIDCSLLETCHLAASGFADLYHHLAGRPPLTRPARLVEVPSIEPTADGWVGFNTNTRLQFEAFLLLIGRLDLLSDDESWALATTRQARIDEWNAIVRSWTSGRTTEEIVASASELRIPVAQVNNGQTVLQHPHFRARGVWARSADGNFTHPLPPYTIDGHRPTTDGSAPALGQLRNTITPHEAPGAESHDRPSQLPLTGVRILDATAWWAGPSSTQVLAALGADVIHLESIQHPDGGRMAAAAFASMPDWWERSAIFLGANTNKRSLTLDLASPRGRELFLELVRECDVLVENFSPRVFENFGLTWDVISGENPEVTMVRMPAFGLDGPWRDNVGFAQTMEQVTGMAWVTGHVYDQPRIPRGPCDPLAGMHSAFAILVGLQRRASIGRGSFIEVSMVEAALNAVAEQVVEYTAYGTVLDRLGNRSRDAAPQGLYRCQGEEQWLAISVETDEQWAALRDALGNPAWAADPTLDTHEGRWAAHDLLDKQLEEWTRERDPQEAAEVLIAHGVPAAELQDARESSQHPQMVARRYFEVLDHPVVGPHPVPGLPFKLASVDNWYRSAAPVLGQHNAAVLQQLLRLDTGEIANLESAGVIGTRPVGLD
jgi:crotonobetainyl-CoA:carnitine CoA-transferase CaiB-like acyl-CoA transferase